MGNQICRPDIYDVLKDAVKDGLIKINEFEEKGGKFKRYNDFPEMSYFDSGMPRFSKSSIFDDKGPVNFSATLGEIIEPEELASWCQFSKIAIEDESLISYWETRDEDENNGDPMHHSVMFDFYRKSFMHDPIKSLVDRYIHTTQSKQYNEKTFLPIYMEWENSIFQDKLFFNILVPILCQTFDFNEIQITPKISIIKMNDNQQLSRNTQSLFIPSVNNALIGAATHAFLLKGWSIRNKTLRNRQENLYEGSNYSNVINDIEQGFAALRIATGIETGYSQIVLQALGWGSSWMAYLPNTHVITVRAFPEKLEEYGWLRTPQSIDKGHLGIMPKIIEEMQKESNKSLSLAIKRLNAAYLRKDKEDTILDISIALEALFSDDNKSEMTHKLSMRIATLNNIKPFRNLSSQEVFELCKDIYAYRSAVVHGAKNAFKKSIVKINGAEANIIQVALDLLRHSIQVICTHPKLNKPKEIDKCLLSGDWKI